jgi:hypothetical protein
MIIDALVALLAIYFGAGLVSGFVLHAQSLVAPPPQEVSLWPILFFVLGIPASFAAEVLVREAFPETRHTHPWPAFVQQWAAVKSLAPRWMTAITTYATVSFLIYLASGFAARWIPSLADLWPSPHGEMDPLTWRDVTSFVLMVFSSGLANVTAVYQRRRKPE